MLAALDVGVDMLADRALAHMDRLYDRARREFGGAVHGMRWEMGTASYLGVRPALTAPETHLGLPIIIHDGLIGIGLHAVAGRRAP